MNNLRMFQPLKGIPEIIDYEIEKKIVIEGTGKATPGDGYTVYVRYLVLHKNIKIECEWNKVRKFRLCLLEIPGTFAYCISSMKKGEIAEFFCKPNCPDCPKNPEKFYKIELVNFTGKNFNLKFEHTMKKTVITPGEEYSTPHLYSLVAVKFTGLYNKKVFYDNSETENVEFALGDPIVSKLPLGILLALKDFKLHEKSKISLRSSSAFGSRGNLEFNIPPYAEVEYIVELKKLSNHVNGEARLNVIKNYLESITEFYERDQFVVAIEKYEQIVNWLDGDYNFTYKDLLNKKERILMTAYLNTALCYLKAKQPLNVIETCRGALNVNAREKLLYYGKALAYLDISEYADIEQFGLLRQEAKQCLWLAKKIESNDHETWIDDETHHFKIERKDELKNVTLEELWPDSKSLADYELAVYIKPSSEKSDVSSGNNNYFEPNKLHANFSEHQDDYNSAFVVDISPNKDKGILKKILLKGIGEKTPTIGSTVKIHYRIMMLNGCIIETRRNKTFDFTLGSSKILKCWNIAVKTMKKGEIAFLNSIPDYAYLRRDDCTDIPLNKTMAFEIELVDWSETEQDLTPNKDNGITRIQVKKGSGKSKPTKGDIISVYIEGKFDDRKFDKRHIEFLLGDCKSYKVIKGIEMALKKFKTGEMSKLKITSKYAFGATGSEEFGIPPNADVEYTVILKNVIKSPIVESKKVDPKKDEKTSRKKIDFENKDTRLPVESQSTMEKMISNSFEALKINVTGTA